MYAGIFPMNLAPAEPFPHTGVDWLSVHRAWLRADEAELEAERLQHQGLIGFFARSSEPSVSLTSLALLGADDWVVPPPGDHLVALSRGHDLRAFFAHLFGRGAGKDRTPALPRSLRVVERSERPGAALVHGTGVAWAMKMRGANSVVLCLLRADEIESGDFHNAMNFAGVFRLPLVFVAPKRGIASSGIAYGIEAVCAETLPELGQAVASVREKALRGLGASIVEAAIPPMGDGSSPWGVAANAADDEAIRETARAEIRSAVAHARDRPKLSVESLFEGVFREPTWNLKEDRAKVGVCPRAPAFHPLEDLSWPR